MQRCGKWKISAGIFVAIAGTFVASPEKLGDSTKAREGFCNSWRIFLLAISLGGH